jgi:hypothetical protein
MMRCSAAAGSATSMRILVHKSRSKILGSCAALVSGEGSWQHRKVTTTVWPICGSDAEVLPRTGDFESFDCKQHDRFNVTDTALQIRRGKASVG